MTMAKPSRRRATTTTKAVDTAEIEALMQRYNEENKAANAARRKADMTRAELLEVMDHAQVAKHAMEVLVNRKPKLLAAEVGNSQLQKIDTDKLYKNVDLPTFMQCVSATQKAVTEYAGSAIAARCTYTDTGTRNVSVKLVNEVDWHG